METSKNKFTIGELVKFNFKRVKNSQNKVGIVLKVTPNRLYVWTYLIRWNNGEEQVYPEYHLAGIPLDSA